MILKASRTPFTPEKETRKIFLDSAWKVRRNLSVHPLPFPGHLETPSQRGPCPVSRSLTIPRPERGGGADGAFFICTGLLWLVFHRDAVDKPRAQGKD